MARLSRTEKRIKDNKEALLKTLSSNGGIVASACKAANISRTTYYDWYHNDPEFREHVDDIAELQKDFAEALILKKMKEGDTTMIIFYAKTKMKDRGYTERQELTGADGQPLIQNRHIDFSKLSEHQRETLLAIGEQVLDDTSH